MDEQSDQALAAEVAQGNAAALRSLYGRYGGQAFNFVLRMTGDRGLAEDLVQETFTRVWTMARTYDPARGRFKGWLFTIALNLTRSELGKKRYSVKHLDAEGMDVVSEAEGPHEELARAERERRVAGALRGLPPYLREVVIMKVYHQLKFREIAEMTRTPEGTLKARFHRAVAELRLRLAGSGGERP
jgi:RNA polymerase sigma-70 factor, ECF subfamily